MSGASGLARIDPHGREAVERRIIQGVNLLTCLPTRLAPPSWASARSSESAGSSNSRRLSVSTWASSELRQVAALVAIRLGTGVVRSSVGASGRGEPSGLGLGHCHTRELAHGASAQGARRSDPVQRNSRSASKASRRHDIEHDESARIEADAFPGALKVRGVARAPPSDTRRQVERGSPKESPWPGMSAPGIHTAHRLHQSPARDRCTWHGQHEKSRAPVGLERRRCTD